MPRRWNPLVTKRAKGGTRVPADPGDLQHPVDAVGDSLIVIGPKGEGGRPDHACLSRRTFIAGSGDTNRKPGKIIGRSHAEDRSAHARTGYPHRTSWPASARWWTACAWRRGGTPRSQTSQHDHQSTCCDHMTTCRAGCAVVSGDAGAATKRVTGVMGF